MIKGSSFTLIALRVGESCAHGRRVLKDNTPYYFCQGHTISEDSSTITVNPDKCIDNDVFNDYLQEKAGKGHDMPHVSIHAIVGKNGSGKSTLVEMLIRLLNNFSAIIFGEQITGSNTAHLHYIDKLEGELYYSLGGSLYRLRVCRRVVNLDKYRIDSDNLLPDEVIIYKKFEDKNIEEISVKESEPILEDLDADEGDSIRHYINAFFYTIVSNYSIYAYNTLDYSEENVSLEYEKKILENKFGEDVNHKKIKDSSRNWLHGLFNKNDGYKSSLVLTPFREEGIIDINAENALSRERFISLLLMSNQAEGQGLRRINGHLDVDHFCIMTKGNYDLPYINRTLEIKEISDNKYLELRISILYGWNVLLFGVDSGESIEHLAKLKKYGQTALDYLLYKTIKICTKYGDYQDVKDSIENYLEDKDNGNEMIDSLNVYFENLKENRSHITRKIRQTIAYLLTPIELDMFEQGEDIDVVELSQGTKRVKDYFKKKYPYDFYIRDIEDFLPPPFLDVEIQMKEVNSNNRGTIAFETLSSGEKQQVYSISSILYHLMNLNSVEEDKLSRRYGYHYVNVVLEEIELYFHPDFQKHYISMILDGLAQMSLNNIYGVNFCFVTHSPFVLSDIPRSNLLALEDGRRTEANNLKTFGANIYDMLKNSFFIEGMPIGDYAKWVINRIIVALRIWRCIIEHPDITGEDLMIMVSSPKIDNQNLLFFQKYIKKSFWEKGGETLFKNHYSAIKLRKMIEQVDEPLVRSHLTKELYEVFHDEMDKQKMINMLKSRLKELEEY